MQNITKEGFSFSFNPSKCEQCQGKCCTGESGYIWLDDKNSEKISKYLNITQEEFFSKYVIGVQNRYSLREVKIGYNNYACVFFDNISKKCSIYDVRPNQCKTYPFWNSMKTKSKQKAVEECMGIVVK